MLKILKRFSYPINLWIQKDERSFLTFIIIALLLAMFSVPNPNIAMWVGFLFAAYAAVANDSIQTLGTFIASNQDKKWWVLWIFIGSIFLLTVGYSWVFYNGDVSHGRLLSKGFDIAPKKFHFLQIAAPIFLLILTRLRMPVSTTFILLTSFATAPAAIGKVLVKSLSGYILAFFLGLSVFLLISKLSKKYFIGKPKFIWTIIQWITSGTLWSVWLMQDAANIAVYLPRDMNFLEFLGFAATIFCGLGMLLYFKGGRIQKIVTEKSVVHDVRFATIIDFIYCLILFYFKLYSQIPMSTTWVFIGLLGGREIAMSLRNTGSHGLLFSVKLLLKDFTLAFIGLIISIIIAIQVNQELTFTKMIQSVPNEFISSIKEFFLNLMIK